MRQTIKHLVILYFIFSANCINKSLKAQIDSAFISNHIESFDSSGVIQFKSEMIKPGEYPPPFHDYISQLPDYQLHLTSTWTDNLLGLEHYRYQLYYHDVPVEGAEYTEHAKNGYLIYANGKMANLSVPPKTELDEETALSILLTKLNRQQFAWEDEDWEFSIKQDLNDPLATYYPKGELIWGLIDLNDIGYSIPSDNYKLAYKFNLQSLNPRANKEYLVCAITGEILREFDLQINDGPANIPNHGTFDIDTRPFGNRHILFSNNQNRNIHTKNYTVNAASNREESWNSTAEIIDDDDDWGNFESNATRIHWMLTNAWDYFETEFGWIGVDLLGREIRVLANDQEANASYEFTAGSNVIRVGTRFGSYLGVLDVMAHEYTHGISKHTANFFWASEPAALNESFADIFSVMVERFVQPNQFDWTFQEDAFILNERIRSLMSPRDFGHHLPNQNDCLNRVLGQPNTYEGDFWFTFTSLNDCDLGGAHINNSVQNFWFYLLAEGGTGINDNGDSYNIQSIGIDNAAALTFYNLTNNLQTLSVYNDARALSIMTAELMFNNCSFEHIQVTNAWNAVGIGNQSPCITSNLEDNFNSKLSIYPNPVNDNLHINYKDKTPLEITIYNLLGNQFIDPKKFNSTTHTINVSLLDPGMYILVSKSSNRTETFKFVKQ